MLGYTVHVVLWMKLSYRILIFIYRKNWPRNSCIVASKDLFSIRDCHDNFLWLSRSIAMSGYLIIQQCAYHLLNFFVCDFWNQLCEYTFTYMQKLKSIWTEIFQNPDTPHNFNIFLFGFVWLVLIWPQENCNKRLFVGFFLIECAKFHIKYLLKSTLKK